MTQRSRTASLQAWQVVESWQVITIDRVRDDSATWGDQGRIAQEWFDRGELEFEVAAAAAAQAALTPETPRGFWNWLRSALYGEPGPTLDLAALEG